VSERVDKLKEGVETMHKCKARHVRSNWVVESFQGKVAWDGVVETFDLEGHPAAKRCYAWSFRENGEPKYTTVLELPPVDSPQTAVKVAIASEAKQ
jgi:hypothetical protein